MNGIYPGKARNTSISYNSRCMEVLLQHFKIIMNVNLLLSEHITNIVESIFTGTEVWKLSQCDNMLMVNSIPTSHSSLMKLDPGIKFCSRALVAGVTFSKSTDF